MHKWILILTAIFVTGCSSDMDIKYTNEPHLIPFLNNYFRLGGDFIVYVEGGRITIPKGFVTDLASIPRILWPIYSPSDTKTIPAAILHDFLYCCSIGYTRKDADLVFYYALLESGTSIFRANKYYYAVRLFGWRCWNPNKC